MAEKQACIDNLCEVTRTGHRNKKYVNNNSLVENNYIYANPLEKPIKHGSHLFVTLR